mgnify:CR=1 FL=1
MTLLDVMKAYKEKYGRTDLFAIMDDYNLDERLNRNTLNKYLLDELGAMQVWYEDCDTYKIFQDNLFDVLANSISKLLDAINAEYNPIANTNIVETTTIEIDQVMDTTKADSGTDSYTDTDTDSGTDTREVSAFDESTYQPNDKRTTSDTGNRTHSGSKTTSGTKNEDLDWDETDTKTTVGYKDRDIQEAIMKQFRIAEYNVYFWIVKKYKEDLMVLCY